MFEIFFFLKSLAPFYTVFDQTDRRYYRRCHILCDVGAFVHVYSKVYRTAIRSLRIDVMTIAEHGSIFLFSKHRSLFLCTMRWSWLSLDAALHRKSYTPRWQRLRYSYRKEKSSVAALKSIRLSFSRLVTFFFFLFPSRTSERFLKFVSARGDKGYARVSRWKNRITGNTGKPESTRPSR